MKFTIFGFLLFLAACNGGGSSSAAPGDATAIAALRAEVVSLQADNAALKTGQAKLKIVGHVHGIAAQTQGIGGGNFLPDAVNFGPCPDMGVLIGFVSANNASIADPLYAKYQAFKQCTGFSYETDVTTGTLAPASRLYWDGPNCTGGMWEWNASGSSYNDQSLSTGVVFLNPADMTTELMVEPGQTPQMVQAASVYIVSNGDCEADSDLQPMYKVTVNDTQITGVPGSVGSYNLGSP